MFLCKISAKQLQEDGREKTVTDSYLVDAVSYTEAEARIVEESRSIYNSEFAVKEIRKTNIQEIVMEDGSIVGWNDGTTKVTKGNDDKSTSAADKWFRVTVYLITINERTGKEKKNPMNIVVQAGSVREAHDITQRYLRDCTIESEIGKVDDTDVLDVYYYPNDGIRSAQ